MRQINGLGMTVLLGYCFFNLTNVLFLRANAWFVGLWLLGIGSLFVFQRLMTITRKGFAFPRAEVGGYLLVLLITMVIMTQPLFITTNLDDEGVDTLANIRTIWMVSVIWMCAGGAASMFEWKESSLVAVAVAGTLFIAFLLGVGFDGTVAYQEIRDEATFNASHLTLEKYVIILLAFAYAMSHRTRLIVALAGMLVLFSMGGRTALAVFTLTVILLNLRGGRVMRTALAVGVLGVALFFIGRVAVDSGFVDVQSSEVRDMLFLDGLEEDSSFAGRQALLQQGLGDLAEQFWIGNFPLTVERHGYFSTYIHNLLSAWQFFGFFAFMALSLALVLCLRRMRQVMRHAKPTPADLFSAFMLIYVVISVVLAKSVMWNLLWFALGLWLFRASVTSVTRAAGSRKRRRRRSRPRPDTPSTSAAEQPVSA